MCHILSNLYLQTFFKETEVLGHIVGALRLWESGFYALIELNADRQPVDIMLISAAQHALLQQSHLTQTWRHRADVNAKPIA